ncbi:MAG: hypothetical protein C5B52_02865 [Bacteroidetes bacterium]|nr:MAG: hypothetical protein C5B52_02865 [Bacteroidota bacterium]
MNLLNLFKKPTSVILEFRDTLVIIGSRNQKIFCPYSKSQGGKYHLAYCDGDPENGVFGFRQSGEGYYFLIEDLHVIREGRLQRPNDGQVSDNGTFIVSDWLFGEELKSRAYCFDKNGDLILDETFYANMLCSSISNNGRYAIFHTLGSDSEDSNSIFIYDLSDCSLVLKKKCDYPRPNSYSIDEIEMKILINYDSIGSFAMSLNGEIEERLELNKAYVATLSGNRLIYESIALLNEFGESEDLINLIRKGLLDQESSVNTKAVGYKFLGEIYEERNIQIAIDYFENALACNPKIGLKKKLQALRKKVQIE